MTMMRVTDSSGWETCYRHTRYLGVSFSGPVVEEIRVRVSADDRGPIKSHSLWI